MIFKKTFKYRLNPTKEQGSLFAKFAGAKRWIYNRSLFQRKEAFEKEKKRISLFDQNNGLVLLKKQQDLSWLKEVHSQVLQQALSDLDKAYQNFFRGLKQKIKIGFPRFKCKGIKDSFRYPQGVKVNNAKVFFPKIGWVCFRESRIVEGKIKQTTIVKEGEYWYVSFACEIEKEPVKHILNKDKTLGIDLGIKTFATMAVGKKNHLVTIENPKFLKKSLKKLRFLNRRLSKKRKGSKNRYKARIALSKFHIRLRNLRLDFFYKLALEIVKNHDIISVEKMNIKKMLQGLKSLSRSISDAGWGIFLNCLKNKALEYGKTLYEVSSLLASTRKCSKCGNKKEMSLRQREYICECGNILDRDLNAAINIKNLAVGTSV
jgi:putative transposase